VDARRSAHQLRDLDARRETRARSPRESGEELAQLRRQVEQAQIAALDQSEANCCYARSDKYWTTDPQGIAWETFHTLESIPLFGEDSHKAQPAADRAACCTPASAPARIPMNAAGGGCCG
jgi:hypothetical protein